MRLAGKVAFTSGAARGVMFDLSNTLLPETSFPG